MASNDVSPANSDSVHVWSVLPENTRLPVATSRTFGPKKGLARWRCVSIGCECPGPFKLGRWLDIEPSRMGAHISVAGENDKDAAAGLPGNAEGFVAIHAEQLEIDAELYQLAERHLLEELDPIPKVRRKLVGYALGVMHIIQAAFSLQPMGLRLCFRHDRCQQPPHVLRPTRKASI
eukprot:2995720-Rhodomonas_salina.1